MSHVSTVKTAIKDLKCLKETLKELGLSYYEGQKIQGRYLGGGQKVDLVIEQKNGSREIGMVKSADGTYAFKGDFYGSNNSFTEKIIQKYTVKMIRSGLNKLGVNGIVESVQEDGTVKLVANY